MGARDGSTLDLAAVQVGDEVAWLSFGHFEGTQATIGTVSRITPTQIVVQVHGARLPYRFSRKDGSMQKNYGTYLLSALDGRVVNARCARVARQAALDIETLARKASIRDSVSALSLMAQVDEITIRAREQIRILLEAMDGAAAQ